MKRVNKKGRVNARDAARMRNGVVRRKRRKRKYTLYYILMFIILITMAISLSLTVFFNIDEIEILNSNSHTEEEIISASNVKIGDNLFRTSLKNIEDNILDSCLDFDKVIARRSFPNKLVIECVSCSVKFCYQKNDGRYVYVSNYGRITEVDQPEPLPNTLTLKINSELFENCQKGQYIELEKEDEIKINSIIAKLDSVGFKDINMISFDESSVYITYQNRIVIEISDMSKLDYIINMSRSIIDSYIGINEHGRIFLDNSNQSIHFLPETT